ncbi:MAG TPA: mandelate racemase/muconate lactonizing enzyme family protein [Gemmataceae bacterium]|nr:mandelate racemase/muconate lactonizing enzyme family protein [Gemmataceae bacterium]
MKITKLETIWHEPLAQAQWVSTLPEGAGQSRQALPNNLWVRVHSSEGLIGLGETYYMPRAVSAIIHDAFATLLIGRSVFDIENHWSNLFSLVNFSGFAGAEMRAISAIDVALWDLLGQYTGQPIYNLLGGRSRDRIAVYNTCVSYGKYQDYHAFMEGRAGELAEDLLRQGIRAMKVWPFDQFGVTLAGPSDPRGKVYLWGGESAAGPPAHLLDKDDLKKGLACVEAIRCAAGDRMAIAIEGHARWDLPAAVRIARALEPYDIMWLEEIIPPDNAEAYARLKAETRVPLCVSERLFTRFGFRQVVEKHAADIIMPDMAWGGGITETRKVCALADTYYLPVTLHDCIGPVALWSAAHMMLHVPNGMIQETVRGYWDGWYNDVVTDRLQIEDGYLSLPGKPGLGTALRDEVLQHPAARVELTGEPELLARAR